MKYPRDLKNRNHIGSFQYHKDAKWTISKLLSGPEQLQPDLTPDKRIFILHGFSIPTDCRTALAKRLHRVEQKIRQQGADNRHVLSCMYREYLNYVPKCGVKEQWSHGVAISKDPDGFWYLYDTRYRKRHQLSMMRLADSIVRLFAVYLLKDFTLP